MANLLSTTVNGQLNTGNVIDLGYTVNGSIATTEFRGINFHSFGDLNYYIGKPAGSWTQPLHIHFYTGIWIRSHHSYGGTRFYNIATGSQLMSVGDGSDIVNIYSGLTVNGSLINTGASYLGIIYDYDNNNYYLNPNGTSVVDRVVTTGRLEVTYNSDRYQMNFYRASASNWWVTNDSDRLGLHLNNVGDKFYFATDGDFWTAQSGWLSTALSNKQNASTAITTSNIASQSVNYASSAGNADTVDGRHADYFYPASTDNGYSTGDIYGSGTHQRLWGTDSVQNLLAFRPPTSIEYSTDGVNWTATTATTGLWDNKMFGKWGGFNMAVGNNVGGWRYVRMTWVNFGYHFFSHFTLAHSTNGHSFNFVFQKSDLNGVFSGEAFRQNGISSWPGYTFTKHSNVSGWWDTRDIRFVFELNHNPDYPNNSISIGHIGLMGGYSGFTRLYDWDADRNMFFGGVIYAATGNSNNWNTAYGWGNHASAGYQSAATAITTSNIGSQSVNYAASAGSVEWTNVNSRPTALSQFTNDSGYITGYTETDTLASVTGRGASTASQISFTKTDDHAISVGTIRGRAVGSQGGEFIQLFERVNIGGPNGWGAPNTGAPTYGLSVFGGATIGYGNSAGLAVTGTSSATGDVRAPIFYDSNDTNYYLDPNSSGTSLRIAGGIAQDNIVGRPYAAWGTGGGATGAVVIKFPGDVNNYGMVHAVIDIYEYNSNDVSTVIVGGHNWGSRWYSYGAQVVGQTNKQVRVGVKDGKYCIVIGDGESSWSYGQVVLRKIQNGTYYSGVMNIAAGYTAAIESDSYSWISEDLRNLETPSNFYAGGNVYASGNIVATQSWVSSNFNNYVLPFSYSTGVSANHVVQRDANGYIYANHINFSTPETENPAISSFITSNGDGWSRKSSLAHVRNQLGNYGNWITTDGRAYPRRSDGTSINFYWSGQSGQPTWLWGSNDGENFYVWNPSNFSVNYASSAGNADTVDSYHASSLWRSDGGTWNPGANILLGQTGNGQEWSFDITRNGYTGGYWHVWDSVHSTMLGVDATNNYVWATGSMRAPIFYDYNNTGYYGDFASTSVMNAIRFGTSTNNATLYGNDDWGVRLNTDSGWIQFGPANSSWAHIYSNLPFYFNQDLYVNGTRVVLNSGTWGINITGNSNTTSQVVFSDLKGNFPSGAGGGYSFGSNHYSMGLDAGDGGWNHPHYRDLIIGYHTGIRIGAHYSGIRFYNNSPTTDANNDGNGDGGEALLMTIGGYVGTANQTDVVVNNNLFANVSMRAPIFYDSNDTGYYLDPNGTSNLNQISASTSARWGRSGNYWTVRPSIHSGVGYWTGTNGWGTGEGTWANAWKGGFSGWDIWGTGTDHPQGSGYVHAQGIVSGQHYTTTDGGEAYGWMMVGAADAITNRYWLRGKWGTTTSAWTEIMTSNQNTYAWNMDQWVRTTDSVSFVATTSSTFLVNSHSDNTKGYRLYNTSNSSVSAMFTNSSNQLVIAAGAFDQINLNKKVYVNGVALGVNVSPSATAGRIDASNDIVAYSSSDERLKYNITPIENAIEKVKSLTGVEFDWKPEYKHAHGYEGHDTGIIAQQVQEVIPSAVRTNDTGFLAVRYEKLIGLLVEGMKEQQAQIEELKAKLDGLTK